jgi:hypothetical protein
MFKALSEEICELIEVPTFINRPKLLLHARFPCVSSATGVECLRVSFCLHCFGGYLYDLRLWQVDV